MAMLDWEFALPYLGSPLTFQAIKATMAVTGPPGVVSERQIADYRRQCK
jgi:hypothetical protein